MKDKYGIKYKEMALFTSKPFVYILGKITFPPFLC